MILPPLSLYIHTPWCVKKCPYCDFNSHSQNDIPFAEYLSQLKLDLLHDLPLSQQRPIQSIFIGGGTPSLMPGWFYSELFEFLTKHLTFAADIEITLEANPGTLDAGHFADYRAAGINRLSIGIQSFDAQQLSTLGRIHNPNQVFETFNCARQLGFNNINTDLMFGLPKQSIAEALNDLRQAIALNPEHISWYQLTIEQNTEFFRTPPQLPEDDLIWEMHQQGIALLASHGYHQYEVSAFAKEHRQSRHNLNYWQFGDYLGIGAGAHGKITSPDGQIQRQRKTRLPKDYLNKNRLTFGHNDIVAQSDLPFEFMMNALRLKQGVAASLFKERTGLELTSIHSIWHALQAKGLMANTHDQLVTSKQGYLYLNEVLAAFLHD